LYLSFLTRYERRLGLVERVTRSDGPDDLLYAGLVPDQEAVPVSALQKWAPLSQTWSRSGLRAEARPETSQGKRLTGLQLLRTRQQRVPHFLPGWPLAQLALSFRAQDSTTKVHHHLRRHGEKMPSDGPIPTVSCLALPVCQSCLFGPDSSGHGNLYAPVGLEHGHATQPFGSERPPILHGLPASACHYRERGHKRLHSAHLDLPYQDFCSRVEMVVLDKRKDH
jgi:hypothetical protein